MSLAVDSDANSQEVHTWERFLPKSSIHHVANGEDRVADDCLGVLFSGDDDLINGTFIKLLHDELSICLAAAFKGLFVDSHKRWEYLWLVFLGLFNDFDNNVVRFIL